MRVHLMSSQKQLRRQCREFPTEELMFLADSIKKNSDSIFDRACVHAMEDVIEEREEERKAQDRYERGVQWSS